MGAYFYGTTITKKGLLGIILVVIGSISYAMERIRINKQERETDKAATKSLLSIIMVFRRKQITSWNDDDSLSYVCALSSPSYLSFLYDVTSLTSYASSHYMSKVDY